MLLLTLQGLRGPMSYRLIRESILQASGAAAYSHLLQKIVSRDPLNLSIPILQTLDDFLGDVDVCEAAHKAGMTSQLLDLVPEYVSKQIAMPMTHFIRPHYSLPRHVGLLAGCVACILFRSEAARIFVETRADLIPLTYSTLTSSQEDMVRRGVSLCIPIAKNPNLHAKFIESGLCTVLVNLATRYVCLIPLI
jgi:hypothetical protein